MLAVGLKRDQGASRDDALERGDALGDDLRKLVVMLDSDDRDQILVPGNGVHLADAIEV